MLAHEIIVREMQPNRRPVVLPESIPDEFYKEISRLRGWKWPVPSGKRPGIGGTYSGGGEGRKMKNKVLWRGVCQFLAGAFFVSAGVLFYLYMYRVSVPIFSTGLIETPEISGTRSLVHAALFLIFLYVGFIRRWNNSN